MATNKPKRWEWEEWTQKCCPPDPDSSVWKFLEDALCANDPYIDHLEERIKELEAYVDSGIPKTGIQIIAENHETISKLKEALEFYAKKEHWGTPAPGDTTAIDPCDWLNYGDKDYRGGFRARTTLNECFGSKDE